MFEWSEYMIDLSREGPISKKELTQPDNINSTLQNSQRIIQEPKIDLTSGNELSPEGKIFCARYAQKIRQEPKIPQTTEKEDHPQNAEFSELGEGLTILADLQKLRLEEAALIGVKQHLTEAQQEFQNRVKEEIERTKIEITNLWSEIDVLENNCKELAELVQTPFSKSEHTKSLGLQYARCTILQKKKLIDQILVTR
jgi:hypothetical protein